MERLKILCYLWLCFFSIGKTYASGQPAIKTNISINNAVIGQAITLEINVKADKNAAVSWQLCDELFRQSEQLTLLSISSSASNGYFKHQVLFTCLKPIHFSIDGLPILIDQQKRFTSLLKINFRPAKLPVALHDIKPPEQVGFLYPVRSLIYFLSIPLIVFVTLLALLILKRRGSILTAAELQQIYLTKLYSLETTVPTQGVIINEIIDQTWSVFTEYLQMRLFYQDKQTISDLPNKDELTIITFKENLDTLKFSPPQLATQLYPLFLNDIKEFINQAPAG